MIKLSDFAYRRHEWWLVKQTCFACVIMEYKQYSSLGGQTGGKVCFLLCWKCIYFSILHVKGTLLIVIAMKLGVKAEPHENAETSMICHFIST